MQNTSTAVMQRRVEPHDSLDDFPTPPWATRALMEHVIVDEFEAQTAWEPACNRGFMARPLGEYFSKVFASDVHDYGWSGQQGVYDFLFPGEPQIFGPDYIITNPPFRLAERFVTRGLEISRVGVAVIVRSAFLEGIGRYENLFKIDPPSIIAQFCERVPMVKGRVDKEAASATAYSWLVWLHGEKDTRFKWIPACRKRLERQGDYTWPRNEGNP